EAVIAHGVPLTTAAKEVCGQDLGHLEDARQRTCQGVALHPRGQGVLHLSLLGATAAALRGLMAGTAACSLVEQRGGGKWCAAAKFWRAAAALGWRQAGGRVPASCG